MILLKFDPLIKQKYSIWYAHDAFAFNSLPVLSASKGQTFKLRGKNENDSKVATMREWRVGMRENLVQIPEHKTGKSALFSVAATQRKCKS